MMYSFATYTKLVYIIFFHNYGGLHMGWDLSCAFPYPLRWPIVTHSAKGSHLWLCDAIQFRCWYRPSIHYGMGRLVNPVMSPVAIVGNTMLPR